MPDTVQPVSERARNLIERSLVWGNHSCMPLRADESFLTDLERFRKVGVIGINGIGKEFYRKNPGLFPSGLSNASTGLAMVDPEKMPAIVDGLARAELTDDQIRGVLGGNWPRVAKQVWK